MYLLTDCIYKVVSHSELDGFHVDHFHDLAEAREFAASLSAEGYDCVTCRVLEAFDAKARDDSGWSGRT